MKSNILLATVLALGMTYIVKLVSIGQAPVITQSMTFVNNDLYKDTVNVVWYPQNPTTGAASSTMTTVSPGQTVSSQFDGDMQYFYLQNASGYAWQLGPYRASGNSTCSINSGRTGGVSGCMSAN